MILELAMRFRSVNAKCFNLAKNTFMILIFLLFCTAAIIESIRLNTSSDEIQTEENLSYSNNFVFLFLFLVMLTVNIDLLWQIRKQEKLDAQMLNNSMKREKRLLITVLALFEFSYFIRFLNDLMGPHMVEKGERFKQYLFMDLTYFFEGVSFISLLIFHYKNFNVKKSSHR